MLLNKYNNNLRCLNKLYSHYGTTTYTKNYLRFNRYYAQITEPDSNSNLNLNSNKLNNDIELIINSYPTNKNASPYDILNIKSNDSIDPKQLKKIFFKFAKIYHPDSNSHSITSINDKIKDERFKKILSAYNLLKNPISKSNYDNYKIGWNDNINLRTNPNMYNPSSYQYRNHNSSNYQSNFYKSNFTSYETGTWEDKYKYGYETAYGFQNDKSWNTSKNGDWKQEFKDNKRTIILSTLLTLTIYGCLQLTHLYFYDDLIGEEYNKSLSSSNISVHEKSEDDLFHAYTNYGLGDTKQDRINRFLWWRKLSMSFSLADVREVLDHFYKRGIVDDNLNDEAKLKNFELKR